MLKKNGYIIVITSHNRRNTENEKRLRTNYQRLPGRRP